MTKVYAILPVGADELKKLRIDGQAIILAAKPKKVGFSSGFATATTKKPTRTPDSTNKTQKPKS
jgi:hypothetical protein